MKRSIESRLDDLEEQTTGEDRSDFEFNIVHVMSRERAERENREILGPAENAAEDAVKVAIDDD